MPTRRGPSTTGMPLISCRFISAMASESGASGPMVCGSVTMPLSCFLTFCTSPACWAMVRFLWMKPSPPSCAMAMAVLDSVTVSIAAETRGIFSSIWRVNRDAVRTSRGRTSLAAGRSSTSSNVRPMRNSVGNISKTLFGRR